MPDPVEGLKRSGWEGAQKIGPDPFTEAVDRYGGMKLGEMPMGPFGPLRSLRGVDPIVEALRDLYNNKKTLGQLGGTGIDYTSKMNPIRVRARTSMDPIISKAVDTWDRAAKHDPGLPERLVKKVFSEGEPLKTELDNNAMIDRLARVIFGR